MTLYQLKKEVAIQLGLYILLSVILIISLVYIVIYNKAICSKNQNIIDGIDRINFRILEVHNETDKKESLLNKYSDLWKRISFSHYKYIVNLDFKLNSLYKKYCILSPEIYVAVPEDVEISYISKYTKVVKRKVNLSFSAISDKHVFLFLKSVPSLPGYVMIKSLILSKEKDLDTMVINQILNGDMIETIRANVVFDWYTILKNEN
ncbi:hypothetical protein BIY23_00825 [Wolbachia pipientis]|uniref:Uncharacterized protein n=1 Tax=Wolbachia pipientis TaxID=955 RepID=A0A1E7QKL7_WOLPI|nr:hypothetical protein [Wolbachia pipientis]OEY87018.1 hypothetical protein BIY23_00825 [Wolbachia pipientis]